MQYDLLTYRNLQPDVNIKSSHFLYLYGKFQKDIKEKKLDPFAVKIMGQMPQ